MLTALLAAVGYVMYCLFQPPVISGQTAFGFLDANLLRCALGFSAGIGVYWAVHRLGMGHRLAGTTRLCDAIGFASIFGMVVLMLASSRHPPIRDYLLSIAVAMSCVTFVPFSRFVKASLSPKKLVFLGDISYSIYLVHYPLQLVIYSIAEREAIHMPYASPAFLAAYTGFVIAVAAMTHRCVELPWQARFLSLTKRKENQPA
jgi:peptidoglycan/LPS O-acetylase OafA/YrhL